MKTVISVIIPVYNRERYINKCVDSVLGQTFGDLEVILVDDGSFDRSPEICDEYAKRDSRIKVIHKDNGGVSSARNEGLKKASGEYIVFIDSDDYIDNDFFEYAYRKAKEHQVSVFAAGTVMEVWNNDCLKSQWLPSTKKGLFGTVQALEEWACNNREIYWVGPVCKLYKRSLIVDNNISFNVEMHWGEDTWFNLDVLNKTDMVYCSDRVFYHAVRDSGKESLTSGLLKDEFDIQLLLYKKRKALMKSLGCSKQSLIELDSVLFSCAFNAMYVYRKFCNCITPAERLGLVKKIANNKDIKKIKLKNIKSCTKKITLLLIKLKCYSLVWFIFDLYFRIRLKNKET